MTKVPAWTLEPQTRPWGDRLLRLSARGLRRTGASLARLARRWHLRSEVAVQQQPVFEFHAEAGAPEGALFVDGQRVGVLEGVRRL